MLHRATLTGRFPGDVGQMFPARSMVPIIGDQMYNFELEGHVDTLLLAGDGAAPAWPLTLTCTLGKYLGERFGWTIWTRRTVPCANHLQVTQAIQENAQATAAEETGGEAEVAEPAAAAEACPQCAAVLMPDLNFSDVPAELRWLRFNPFPQVAYPQNNLEEDGGDEESDGRVQFTMALGRRALEEHTPQREGGGAQKRTKGGASASTSTSGGGALREMVSPIAEE